MREGIFDRINTALAEFPMCKDCRSEYENPDDRRFHMQGISCVECGPELNQIQNLKFKIQNNGQEIDLIKNTAQLIKSGEIVAIKGVGGFALTCNMEVKTVVKLRKFIHRPNKPFALIGKNIEMIRKYTEVSDIEMRLLESRERPIVLLKKNTCVETHCNVSLHDISENNRLGFILPYSGLHHLLFEYLDEPIIFTSANMPNHPITTQKSEQFVPHVLDYNREIVNQSDDSIMKVVANSPLLIRRSRGFVPVEIPIPPDYQTFSGDILAMGAEMKSAFCLKRGNTLLLSPEMGNTAYEENFNNYKNALDDFLRFTGAKPEVILCDAYPIYNTHKYALKIVETRFIASQCETIQHHLSHIFSVAIEHDLTNFIGIAADGTGYGLDGKVWGGEVFHNNKRIGKLENQTLVGGDMANKEPIRMLVGILSKFLGKKEIVELLPRLESTQIDSYIQQKNQNFNCIESSSCGRILDCVAILLGCVDYNSYEGRGVMCLEQLSIHSDQVSFEDEISPIIRQENTLSVLQTTNLFEYVVKHLKNVPKRELATIAQLYLAQGFYKIANKNHPDLPIIWGGGCAYNQVMTSYLIKKGTYVNEVVASGDGGLALGQVGHFLWEKLQCRKQ